MKMLFQREPDPMGGNTQQERNLRITTVPLKVALGAGLTIVIIYGLGDSGGNNGLELLIALRMVGLGLFVAGAFFGLGLLLGFIFGVPRSAQGDSAGATATTEGDKQRLKVNTNLEQISDWLTKILVGVGLTQLSNLPTRLGELAAFIAKGLGDGDNDRLFATGVILYFFVCGFFAGYLLTRLFLAGAFLVADNMSEETVRKVQEMKGEVQSLRMEVYDKGTSPAPSPLPLAATAMPGPEVLQSFSLPDGPPQGLPTWQTLAEQYNQVHRTQSVGETRTRAMAQLFGQMCTLAAHLEDYDPRPNLLEKDGGRRLFAYAYLITRPDPALLTPLVDSVTEPTESNFGQYRGIKCVGQVLAVANPDATSAEVGRLETLLQRLDPSTDRHYELSRILDEHRARQKKAS